MFLSALFQLLYAHIFSLHICNESFKLIVRNFTLINIRAKKTLIFNLKQSIKTCDFPIDPLNYVDQILHTLL